MQSCCLVDNQTCSRIVVPRSPWAHFQEVWVKWFLCGLEERSPKTSRLHELNQLLMFNPLMPQLDSHHREAPPHPVCKCKQSRDCASALIPPALFLPFKEVPSANRSFGMSHVLLIWNYVRCILCCGELMTPKTVLTFFCNCSRKLAFILKKVWN